MFVDIDKDLMSAESGKLGVWYCLAQVATLD